MIARQLKPDRTDSTPLYIQLASNLRDIITGGGLDAGGALPSERVLSEQTGASRVTIRKAIEQLVEEGLLLRRHGSGTYVAPRIEQRGGDLTSFSSDAQNRGAAPSSLWIMKTRAMPTADEAQALGIAENVAVVRLGRVRLANDEPLAIEQAVVPAHFLPDPALIDQSLYSALEIKGYRPVRGTQRIAASLATSIEAGLLSIKENTEVLRIERRTFLRDGTPVELTRSAYRGDRYEFITELADCGDH
jgi:GntR family transcriptional regulator